MARQLRHSTWSFFFVGRGVRHLRENGDTIRGPLQDKGNTVSHTLRSCGKTVIYCGLEQRTPGSSMEREARLSLEEQRQHVRACYRVLWSWGDAGKRVSVGLGGAGDTCKMVLGSPRRVSHLRALRARTRRETLAGQS